MNSPIINIKSLTLISAFVILLINDKLANSCNDNCEHFVTFQSQIDSILENISEDNDSGEFSSLIPERLPGWINAIPVVSNNNIFVLGISDPGMSEEMGQIVAMLRMKTVFSLVTETLVGNMRDFYSRENREDYSNSFIDYTQFEGMIDVNFDDIEIIETHITKYDETILLGKMNLRDMRPQNKHTGTIELSAGILSNARRVGTRTELISRAEVKSVLRCGAVNKDISLFYDTHAVGRRINTETTLNRNKVSALPALGLRYTVENYNEADSLFVNQMGYSLRNGVWYAYLTSILFELADLAHGYAINISNLNEIFDNQSQNLTREIVSNAVNCRKKRIIINSNNLYIYCD